MRGGAVCALICRLPLPYPGPTDSHLPVHVPVLISLDTRTHCTRTCARMQSLGPFHISEILTHLSSLGAPSLVSPLWFALVSGGSWGAFTIPVCLLPAGGHLFLGVFPPRKMLPQTLLTSGPPQQGCCFWGGLPGAAEARGGCAPFRAAAVLLCGRAVWRHPPECMGTLAPSRSDVAASFDFCQFASSLIIKW